MNSRLFRTTRIAFRATFAATACALLLIAAGCSEEPTEENSLVADLPLAGFATRETTLVAQSGNAFRNYFAQDGTQNLVGRNGTYLAYTVMQFTPSTIPDRDTAVVFSAILRLRGVTWSGSSGSPFGFTVHRLTRSWSPYTLTWDSLGTDFYESAVVGSYSGTIGADTGYVDVPLDTSMVRQWMQTSTTTTTSQFGIILIPTAETQHAVRGFNEMNDADSVANIPTLTLIAGNSAGTSRDTAVFTTGLDTFAGTDEHPTGTADDLVMQGGVHFRSVLHFDLSSLPRGAIINSATLTLEQNILASSVSKFVTDPAIATHILRDSTNMNSIDTQDATAVGRRVVGTTGTWTFNIRKATQSWLRGPNYGLVLRVVSAQEFRSPDLYVFSNASAANASLRPRVKILYSIKSN